MKTLFAMDIKNYNPEWKKSKRDSARGIIVFSGRQEPPFAETDKIALVYAENEGYFKFPGGGIHCDEDKVSALIREVCEETGLSVISESIKEYSVVPRFQKSDNKADTVFDQESFYYFCKVSDLKHQQNLDKYEAEAGFKLKITTFKEALEKNLAFTGKNDFDLVMIARDTTVLQLLCGKELIPSRAFSNYLLNQGEILNPRPWKKHSQEVAESAEKIAKAIVENGGNMNPEKAYFEKLMNKDFYQVINN